MMRVRVYQNFYNISMVAMSFPIPSVAYSIRAWREFKKALHILFNHFDFIISLSFLFFMLLFPKGISLRSGPFFGCGFYDGFHHCEFPILMLFNRLFSAFLLQFWMRWSLVFYDGKVYDALWTLCIQHRYQHYEKQ